MLIIAMKMEALYSYGDEPHSSNPKPTKTDYLRESKSLKIAQIEGKHYIIALDLPKVISNHVEFPVVERIDSASPLVPEKDWIEVVKRGSYIYDSTDVSSLLVEADKDSSSFLSFTIKTTVKKSEAWFYENKILSKTYTSYKYDVRGLRSLALLSFLIGMFFALGFVYKKGRAWVFCTGGALQCIFTLMSLSIISWSGVIFSLTAFICGIAVSIIYFFRRIFIENK